MQLGKDWEAEWVTIRDYQPPPAPETSLLPEFAYKGNENRISRMNLVAIEVNNTPKKVIKPRQLMPCDAMTPTQAKQHPISLKHKRGRGGGENKLKNSPSSPDLAQGPRVVKVDAISQAPSTSTPLICRNSLSYGIPAPHDHSTMQCTKK